MEGITGKRALVTGGARGIGLAVAKKLLENGCSVYVADWNKETLKTAVSESENKLMPIEVDVSKWNETRKVIKDILPIQLLVNSAGIVENASVLEATEAGYYRIMDINLKAIINISQFVANDLIERNMEGSFVNLSSRTSIRAVKNALYYCCSKAAVDMATKCFALELGPKNIRVNALNPTWVRTELSRKLWTSPEETEKVLKEIPLRSLVEVEDVANAALFLLSEQSKMITGHCMLIDGGRTLQ